MKNVTYDNIHSSKKQRFRLSPLETFWENHRGVKLIPQSFRVKILNLVRKLTCSRKTLTSIDFEIETMILSTIAILNRK